MNVKTLFLATLLGLGLSVVYAKDANDIADLFYKLNGDPATPHKKINHTKGFCAKGEFIPQKGVDKNLHIPILSISSLPAQVRYSLGGGNPRASDKTKTRGMAVKINGQGKNGKIYSWELVMVNAEINFAKNADEFYQFFAMRVPVNGKVDVQKIQKLTNEVASFRNYEEYLKGIGITASVANTPFYGVHTFYLDGGKYKDKKIPIRLKLVPVAGVKYASEKELQALGEDFLENDAKNRLSNGKIEYDLYATYANKGDIIDETTALWGGKHKEVLVGRMVVREYEGEGCNQDVFMPNVLPEGIGAPTDPLFEIRNEVYGITFGRRQS